MDDDNHNESDNSDEEYVLGGLGPLDFSMEVEDAKCSPSLRASATQVHFEEARQKPYSLFAKEGLIPAAVINNKSFELQTEESDKIMARAHACTPEVCGGRFLQHSVKIVKLSEANEESKRGNGLVAIRDITKQSVIFTERAAYAVQVPKLMETEEQIDSPGLWKDNLSSVRACQQCFRSMEPVSSCSGKSGELFPLPYLWPNAPFPDEDEVEKLTVEDADEVHTFWKDTRLGRIQCTDCNAFFCNHFCRRKHEEELGRCCALKAVRRVSSLWQTPIVLAARIFVSILFSYRRTKEVSLLSMEGLCGDTDDVTSLELGDEVVMADGSRGFSLRKQYWTLVETLNMTPKETEKLDLPFFARLSSMAARNGFVVTTQSPFRLYHNALIRAAGGRGTEKHQQLTEELARVMGSEDGTLQRGMDRAIEELCACRILAIFSLLARINHSCVPNAAVVSQEYVDDHVDVVAQRNIEKGEEITISYVNVFGKRASETAKRKLELQAKYLFQCECPRCGSHNK